MHARLWCTHVMKCQRQVVQAYVALWLWRTYLWYPSMLYIASNMSLVTCVGLKATCNRTRLQGTAETPVVHAYMVGRVTSHTWMLLTGQQTHKLGLCISLIPASQQHTNAVGCAGSMAAVCAARVESMRQWCWTAPCSSMHGSYLMTGRL